MTTATDTYQVFSAADNVFVRRNNVNNDQSSVWYTTSGVGIDLSGIHQADYGQMLLSNNELLGSDNTFANGTDPVTGNVERIDFTWNSPITVSNSFALALFERGAVGVHDAFAITAVTAIDGAGNPTAFGPPVIGLAQSIRLASLYWMLSLGGGAAPSWRGTVIPRCHLPTAAVW